jgi:exoribonuclease II
MRHAFSSGCITDYRDRMVHDANGNKKDIALIDKLFEEKSSLMYEKVKDYCDGRSADWQREGDLKDQIASDLASHFKCFDLWKKKGQNEKSE